MTVIFIQVPIVNTLQTKALTQMPFYWINPLEDGALEQVDLAIEKGFVAFKMICRDYLPGCNKSMDVLERIAQRGKSDEVVNKVIPLVGQ